VFVLRQWWHLCRRYRIRSIRWIYDSIHTHVIGDKYWWDTLDLLTIDA
jgi:hypothetical protein